MVTLKIKGLSEKEIDRVLEMAWDELTPFETIEAQFGLDEGDIVKIMKEGMKQGNVAIAVKKAGRLAGEHKDTPTNIQGQGMDNKQLKK